jgi:hypothetical protein
VCVWGGGEGEFVWARRMWRRVYVDVRKNGGGGGRGIYLYEDNLLISHQHTASHRFISTL